MYGLAQVPVTERAMLEKDEALKPANMATGRRQIRRKKQEMAGNPLSHQNAGRQAVRLLLQRRRGGRRGELCSAEKER